MILWLSLIFNPLNYNCCDCRRTGLYGPVRLQFAVVPIMLKCEYGVKPGQPGPVGEYLELREWWKVVPWLETRLAPLLEKHLSRYA